MSSVTGIYQVIKSHNYDNSLHKIHIKTCDTANIFSYPVYQITEWGCGRNIKMVIVLRFEYTYKHCEQNIIGRCLLAHQVHGKQECEGSNGRPIKQQLTAIRSMHN